MQSTQQIISVFVVGSARELHHFIEQVRCEAPTVEIEPLRWPWLRLRELAAESSALVEHLSRWSAEYSSLIFFRSVRIETGGTHETLWSAGECFARDHLDWDGDLPSIEEIEKSIRHVTDGYRYALLTVSSLVRDFEQQHPWPWRPDEVRCH